jgi:hypothetical protein
MSSIRTPKGNLNPSCVKSYVPGSRVQDRERIIDVNPSLQKVEHYAEVETTLEIITTDGERIWLCGVEAQMALSDIRAAGL